MSRPALKHIVFITGFGWTHIRPSIHFCVRLAAKFPNVFISVYTPGPLAPQADQYLASYPEAARERVHIVHSIVDIPITNPFDLLTSLERSFGPWIAAQLANPSLEISGLTVETPSYIIEDHINGGIAVGNKQYHSLPIAAWWVSTAASFLGHYGNAENGGGWRITGAVRAVLEKQDPETGKSAEEILAEETIADRVVSVPGLPPHYEHEQMPQSLPRILPLLVHMHKRWASVAEHTSIIVFTSVYELEPVAADACANGLTKPLAPFCVGLAADLPPPVRPNLDSDKSDPVLSFMNRAYSELGTHSVIYIAFGSHFFPTAQSTSHLKILIEEIGAHGLRLVCSVKPEHAKAAGLDDDYLEAIKKSGNAIFPDWTQQLQVLEHPALHYFVSHGGWNSTTEAIVRGVPMIFWPMAGDQPTTAMQIARQHDCGFELLQIRTGIARSVAYNPNGDITITGSDEAVRGEVRRVLKMTKGETGAQQRLNVQALGKLARESMEPGGSADVALEKLGKAIGL
ncbi:hypothetical protein FS749_001972 [Ceratobasidium sp. UAMH 11750]|nr:hypothetical protein FS749_001972 [Ceratobasidium sp. UAMH 11750]